MTYGVLTELLLAVVLDTFSPLLITSHARFGSISYRPKTAVTKTLQNFISMVHCQFNTHVRKIRSDNGTKFMCMTSYFRDNWILRETSCVGTPQQNGRVKRKHRHILNVARALRFQASLPIEFWGECIMTAAYLINRTPTPLLAGHTPFERLYKRPPPLTHLRTFGCPCYAHNQNHKGDKFASRSIKGVFLGYPYGKKGWRILNPLTGKIFASRDVIFCESQFPYSNVSASASSSSSSPIITESTVLEEEPVPLSSVRPSSSDSVPPASSDSVLA